MARSEVPYSPDVYLNCGSNWNGFYDCYIFSPVLGNRQVEDVNAYFEDIGLGRHVDWRGNEELWVWYKPC